MAHAENETLHGNQSVLSHFFCLLEERDDDLDYVGSQGLLDHVSNLDEDDLNKAAETILKMVSSFQTHNSYIQGLLQKRKDFDHQFIINSVWVGTTILNKGNQGAEWEHCKVDTCSGVVIAVRVDHQVLDYIFIVFSQRIWGLRTSASKVLTKKLDSWTALARHFWFIFETHQNVLEELLGQTLVVFVQKVWMIFAYSAHDPTDGLSNFAVGILEHFEQILQSLNNDLS